MPFTVSCAACNSRFLLGDDLFRRKVAGKVVTVRCRSCNAEISVDATEPTTQPSQEVPPRRARPSPPRKLREGEAANGTPLPGGTVSATGTPLPTGAVSATGTPLPGALLSIWDAAEKNVGARRKAPPPRPRAFAAPDASVPEFIEDIEEGPPSSSDAPSLNTLTHETSAKNPIGSKRAPDDFLVNLSAGTGGILGAPTINVMSFGFPPPPEVEELQEVEATEITPRTGTVPTFDMSAVLPAANGAAKPVGSSLSPSHLDLSTDVEMPREGQGSKQRTRKQVVAPITQETAASAKPRRAGAVVWFSLVAAAAGVLVLVGLRGRAGLRHAPDPQRTEHPRGLAENAPARELTPGFSALVASEPVPTPSATEGSAVPKRATPTTTTAPRPASGPKSTELAVATPAEKPSGIPAVEQPAVAEKPAPLAPKPEPAEPGAEFDREAAVAALKAAAAQAAACRKDGDPSGTASLTITFAPSGRVTSANIQGPPFAGTPTGGCIANAMRHVHVPAFSGDRVTVSKTIVVE